MRNISPATPEFKNIIEEIHPNEFYHPVMEWLKPASKRIGIDYDRLVRLWRDNRAKFHPEERLRIEDALFEVRLLRDIKRNQIKSAYLRNKISGAINEQSTFDSGINSYSFGNGV